jgi:hypothetical protein
MRFRPVNRVVVHDARGRAMPAAAAVLDETDF